MKKQDMNRDWIATARTLSEALPYLQRYAEAVVVIKLGGHAMTSDQGMETFARDVALMRQVGINPIIVQWWPYDKCHAEKTQNRVPIYKRQKSY